MSLEVFMFPCLNDNYGFLIHDSDSQLTACIDTPDVAAITDALQTKRWALTHILNTHHHWDHTDGNLELKAATNCQIIGFSGDASRIPGIDYQCYDGELFQFGHYTTKIIHTPGHTNGHIVYHFESEKIAFVGDTLFALGCGRLREGSAKQLWQSLQKLMAWPDDTLIYCAHEYTQDNARFALSVEPKNIDLQSRSQLIDRQRLQNTATIPTTIGLEKKTNPFLRPNSNHLQNTINMSGKTTLEVFTETRLLKDRFK